MAEKEKLTIIVFSGDLERALAAFMLATTGASMGLQVDMIFTFWGLDIIKTSKSGGSGKGLKKKILNLVYRGGSKSLKLSRFNMFGLGTWMMKKLMKDTNMPSVDQFITMAHEMGVKLTVCTSTMRLTGVARESFRSEVDNIVGTAYWLNEARQSNVTLFI